MPQIFCAFGWREVVDEAPDAVPKTFAGSLAGAAEQAFELGEDLFDRVQVWAMEPGPGGGRGRQEH